MAPTGFLPQTLVARAGTASSGGVGVGGSDWRSRASRDDLVLESWSQGLVVGALTVMACITLANMRRGVLLHKLILAELLLAMSHGTFCFMAFNGYGWYLSSTAALLYCSWFIHNVVAWLKIKPFITSPRSMFPPKQGLWIKRIYWATLLCTIPPIILQIFDNFRFFNGLNDMYKHVRPYEPLMRDPWWVFTCLTLFHVIRKCYGTGVFGLIQRSPRFGILLVAICLSLIFTVLDIAASVKSFTGSTEGINPWWKISLVMKCLTDTIMLDDFKTELKKLGIKRIKKEENRRQSLALVFDEKDEEGEEHRESTSSRTLQLTNPAALRKERSHSSSSAEGLNGRCPEESDIDNNSSRSGNQAPKTPVGKGGKKISQLPALGSFLGENKPSKKKGSKQDSISEDIDRDLERQAQLEKMKQKRAKVNADEEDVAPDELPPAARYDRLAAMRMSLGIVDYRPET